NVAQSARAMAGVEQRTRHDSDRLREVDDPRVGTCARTYAFGDLEHDRDGAQRLSEPARAGGLLPDAAARERDGLVAQPRRLSADADLDEHEVRTVDRAIEIVRQL